MTRYVNAMTRLLRMLFLFCLVAGLGLRASGYHSFHHEAMCCETCPEHSQHDETNPDKHDHHHACQVCHALYCLPQLNQPLSISEDTRSMNEIIGYHKQQPTGPVLALDIPPIIG